jgi:hypothetical protein
VVSVKISPISMLAASCTLLLLTACSGEPPEPSSAPSNPAPFTVGTRAGTKIHVIQTGYCADDVRSRCWMRASR